MLYFFNLSHVSFLRVISGKRDGRLLCSHNNTEINSSANKLLQSQPTLSKYDPISLFPYSHDVLQMAMGRGSQIEIVRLLNSENSPLRLPSVPILFGWFQCYHCYLRSREHWLQGFFGAPGAFDVKQIEEKTITQDWLEIQRIIMEKYQ